MSTPNNLPSRLREIRQVRGMSQRELAEAAGFKQSAVAQFENGSRMPSLPNLRRLAETLNASADYLIGLDDAVDDMGGPAAAAVVRLMRHLDERDRELLKVLAEGMRKRSVNPQRSRSK